VDEDNYPLGLIHENRLKEYIYSPYGYDLLSKKKLKEIYHNFVSSCPVIDIHTPEEKLLELFLHNKEAEGLIVLSRGQYAGFLDSRSLLQILHDKNLSLAREMNPLTKLPGNAVINNMLHETAAHPMLNHYFIYFDFNHFKPFNDRYGFRIGDRVIQIFAQILQKEFHDTNSIIGHIGGDDFFVGIRSNKRGDRPIAKAMSRVIKKFKESTTSFYSSQERRSGVYSAKTRDGQDKTFELLSASAGLLLVTQEQIAQAPANIEQHITSKFAQLKKDAKGSKYGYTLQRLRLFSED
jgi:diguanylate cyclase (GGDEF)-like protein